MIWITRDGTKMDVRDMTDNHLSNTIAMLDRHIEKLHYDLSTCFGIGFPSDSMAAYYADAEAGNVATKLCDVLRARRGLQEEQERRTQ